MELKPTAAYVVPEVKETHARCGASTSDTATMVRILSCLLIDTLISFGGGDWTRCVGSLSIRVWTKTLVPSMLTRVSLPRSLLCYAPKVAE